MAIGNQLMVYSPQRTAGIGRRTLLPERYGFNPVLPDPTSVNPVGIKPITSVDEALYASTPSQPTGMGVGMSGYEGAAPGKGGMSDAGAWGTAKGMAMAALSGNPIGILGEGIARGVSGGEKGMANYAYDAASWLAGKIGKGLGLSGSSSQGEQGGLYGSHGIVGVGPGGEIGQSAVDGGEFGMSLGEGDQGIGQTAVGDDGLGLAGLGVGGSEGGGASGVGAGYGWGVGYGDGWY